MDKLFFANGDFAAPRYVANIEDVPASHQDWYQKHTGGRKSYRLKPEVWKEIEPLVQQLQAAEREKDEGFRARDAKLEAARVAHARERISSALKTALSDAGVPAALIRAAAAQLQGDHEFEIEDNVVIAQTSFGLRSAAGLVEIFLESESGAAFRPKRAAPTDSYFADLIAGLKRRR